jgi:integrase/recombinase XerD
MSVARLAPVPLPPTQPAPPWPALARYLGQLDSPNTRAAYARHLAAFRALTGCPLAEVQPGHLAAYRATVTARGGASATRAQAIASVRAFLRWAAVLGEAPAIPLDLLRPPRVSVDRPYAVLTEDEIAAAVASAPTTRDKAVLALFLGGALRLAELVALDVSDLVRDGAGLPAVWVRHAKGGKSRMVPVYGWVDATVSSYLGDRTTGPLLLAADRAVYSRESARLGRGGVWGAVRAICRRAGIAKPLSPHSLRHSYAVRHLRAGGNVESLRRILGHSRLETTRLYLDHLELSELLAPVGRPAGL